VKKREPPVWCAFFAGRHQRQSKSAHCAADQMLTLNGRIADVKKNVFCRRIA
jgi:hypothetical protein